MDQVRVEAESEVERTTHRYNDDRLLLVSLFQRTWYKHEIPVLYGHIIHGKRKAYVVYTQYISASFQYCVWFAICYKKMTRYFPKLFPVISTIQFLISEVHNFTSIFSFLIRHLRNVRTNPYPHLKCFWYDMIFLFIRFLSHHHPVWHSHTSLH